MLRVQSGSEVQFGVLERYNEAGLYRDELLFALKDRKKVLEARRVDICMLCRRPKVNAAGICEYCYALLDGEELHTVTRWMIGGTP